MDRAKTKISFSVSKSTGKKGKKGQKGTASGLSVAPRNRLEDHPVSPSQPSEHVSPHESIAGSLKPSTPPSSPAHTEPPKIRPSSSLPFPSKQPGNSQTSQPPTTNKETSHDMAEPPAKRVKRTDSSAMWERNASRSNEVENKPRPTDASVREKRDDKDRHHARDERHHRSRSRERSRDRVEKRRERSRSMDRDRDRDRERDRNRDRDRDRDRERDVGRKKSRSRERDGGRNKNGDRADDRDKRDRKRSRSRERHRSRRGDQFSSLSIYLVSC